MELAGNYACPIPEYAAPTLFFAFHSHLLGVDDHMDHVISAVGSRLDIFGGSIIRLKDFCHLLANGALWVNKLVVVYDSSFHGPLENSPIDLRMAYNSDDIRVFCKIDTAPAAVAHILQPSRQDAFIELGAKAALSFTLDTSFSLFNVAHSPIRENHFVCG